MTALLSRHGGLQGEAPGSRESREFGSLELMSSFVPWWAICSTAPFTHTKNFLLQAVCNDGSPAAYFFAPGTGSGANIWLVYLEVRGLVTLRWHLFPRVVVWAAV